MTSHSLPDFSRLGPLREHVRLHPPRVGLTVPFLGSEDVFPLNHAPSICLANVCLALVRRAGIAFTGEELWKYFTVSRTCSHVTFAAAMLRTCFCGVGVGGEGWGGGRGRARCHSCCQDTGHSHPPSFTPPSSSPACVSRGRGMRLRSVQKGEPEVGVPGPT